MDSQRDDMSGFNAAADHAAPNESAPSQSDVAAAIGGDERRMHVRAYNYWCSLLDGRDYPSIEDLEPGDIADFGPHSVLLDFTEGNDNPATPYIGSAVRAECDLAAEGVGTIADVPSRSLLSRLTDHYMQIIANRAPVGFEAEFDNQRGQSVCYRGILMPFSSDGDTIDFIYGVINWKTVGDSVLPSAPLRAVLPPLDPEPEIEEGDENDEDELLLVTPLEVGEGDEAPGLADHLSAARESADVCKAADGRSRAALYRALAMAYDFSVAARRVPEDYAEILDDAGVKAQARAPMTPIVKLVFGVDYDKTRLTEFAAALSHAERQDVEFGGFEAFVEACDGGLKGLVAAERKARRPDRVEADPVALGKTALRHAAPIALAQLPTNQEFALVLTRRNADGVHEVVELVADTMMLDRALRRAAR